MRSLLVCLFLVPLSGCIVTYHASSGEHSLPATSITTPCHQTIEFSYGLTEANYLSTWSGTYQWTYNSSVMGPPNVARIMEDALHQATGCSSDSLYTPWPSTEIMVRVQEKPYPGHWYGELLGRLSLISYFSLPFYIDEGGWQFIYRVSRPHRSTKTYTYDITAKQFYWVLLLPLSWMNLFTNSLDDAVRSITAQFIADARQDGFLE